MGGRERTDSQISYLVTLILLSVLKLYNCNCLAQGVLCRFLPVPQAIELWETWESRLSIAPHNLWQAPKAHFLDLKEDLSLLFARLDCFPVNHAPGY